MKAISLPGIPAQESGIASAQLNSAQQIGVALGVAVLTTISVSITEYRLPDALTALYTSRASRDAAANATASAALTSGYTTALFIAAILLGASALITALIINAGRQKETTQAATPEASPKSKQPVTQTSTGGMRKE